MISISISSYNQAEFLPDAIESVLNQEFYTGELELIIVDDGSTDNSLTIAKEYRAKFLADKNAGKGRQLKDIKVISQVNKGLSSARNTGIMNSEGEWFFPLDADDILMPMCVYRIREVVQGFCPPDIVAPSFKEFGIRQTNIVLMRNPGFKDFIEANRIPYCSAIRKSKLLECGGYSPRMTFGYEDYHLWFDLLSRGATIKTIPEILVLYRTKEKSMIHDAQNHHEELMNQITKDFPNAGR